MPSIIEEFAEFAAAAGANLEVTLALSHAPAETASAPAIPGRPSRLRHGDRRCRPRHGRAAPTTSVAFVAGPPIMVDIALKHLTHEAKIPRAFIRYDKFA